MANQFKLRFFLIILLLICSAFISCYSSSDESVFSETESTVKKSTVSSSSIDLESGVYLVGAGMYDVTGPCAEVNMMGYADSNQVSQGLAMRLRSRAYIVGDTTRRVIFVNADLWAITQAVKQKVIEKIKSNPELSVYYNDMNVLLSATHTHSGVGGYSHYFLYNQSTSGFVSQNFNIIVDGIYQSIVRAHNNLQPGRIYINRGDVDEFGFNRSITAYNRNPESERSQYSSSINKTMTLLKLVGTDGTEIGMINWLGVHPTSLGPANKLLHPDNKGLAEYWFEKDKGVNYTATKQFTGSFAQSTAGDVSPALWGPAVTTTDTPDWQHLQAIAKSQYNKAVDLYNSASELLTGSIDYRHSYVDMSNVYVSSAGQYTAKAAMGASFAAGSTEDNTITGRLFEEGVTVDSAAWNASARDAFVSKFLNGFLGIAWPASLDPEYVKAHAEKPVLLPTGIATWDGNPWTPQIVPVQIIKIGELIIIAQPSEITTMSGRRICNTVLDKLSTSGVKYAVIAGVSNTYVSYLTTREEYASQQYEGGSTQFGPWTLLAYEQEFGRISDALAKGITADCGPTPADLTKYQAEFTTGVVFDDKPLGKSFGDVLTAPFSSYSKGDVVTVVFQSGHPKNNLMIQDSYLVVEKLAGSSWVAIAHDWDPETKFRWARDGIAYSHVTITWDTVNADPGKYRIRHKGCYKSFWTGKTYLYQGITGSFNVN